MKTIRLLVVWLVFLVAPPVMAQEAERITRFDVAIDVERDGDIVVTETIGVVSQGYEIRRGIYRDLPRFYLKDATKYPYAYDVVRVERDGRREPYAVEKEGNAFRIRIGDEDKFLDAGQHAYVIAYAVKNQVRYFDGHDEVYWNATGNFWAFPIEHAEARIRLPGGASATKVAGYTGGEGETGKDYRYAFIDGAHDFVATRPLGAREGMTVAVAFSKGVVDPPSPADARGEWWVRNLSLLLLGGAAGLISLFYGLIWTRFGRDPAKGPVFPRYAAPDGYSPAAVHHVYNRGVAGNDAFIASIFNLAVHKRLKIDADKERKTTLTRLAEGSVPGPEDRALETDLFASGDTLTFGGDYNATVTKAHQNFQRRIGAAYGAPYFKWNTGFLLFAVILTVGAVIAAANLVVEWTTLHTAGVAILGAMAIAASYFLPAATEKGQAIRTEIEGFKLYLKTAEQLQLNAAQVGSDAPPPMTVERYERFLPYAVALGVEKPWTEHFERLMPREAAEYRPAWSSGRYGGGRSLSGVNSALVSSLASGVSASLPKSASSSGSGGGGSSGGGGGGGGGGGW